MRDEDELMATQQVSMDRPAVERHPDIFTDEMAAMYLRLKGPRSMDTIAQRFKVAPVDLPGERLWHREDLDNVLRQARATAGQRRGRGKNTRLVIGG